jgi:hypothetical protein
MRSRIRSSITPTRADKTFPARVLLLAPVPARRQSASGAAEPPWGFLSFGPHHASDRLAGSGRRQPLTATAGRSPEGARLVWYRKPPPGSSGLSIRVKVAKPHLTNLS